jgi:SAM-dependent methyltransferase
MLYYRYLDFMVRTVATDARSLIDVGTGGCRYLDWFDWIPDRVSLDRKGPYRSEGVRGIEGNLLKLDLPDRFDVCTCFQVLEHVPRPLRFARRLQELGRTVIVSVPHRWPEGRTRGHLHDPVDAEKLARWMQREPNYSIVVTEPFSTEKGERLIAVYDEDPERRFDMDDVRARRTREAAV